MSQISFFSDKKLFSQSHNKSSYIQSANTHCNSTNIYLFPPPGWCPCKTLSAGHPPSAASPLGQSHSQWCKPLGCWKCSVKITRQMLSNRASPLSDSTATLPLSCIQTTSVLKLMACDKWRRQENAIANTLSKVAVSFNVTALMKRQCVCGSVNGRLLHTKSIVRQ